MRSEARDRVCGKRKHRDRVEIYWLRLETHVPKQVGTHHLPDLAGPDNLLRFENSGILTSLQPDGGLDSLFLGELDDFSRLFRVSSQRPFAKDVLVSVDSGKQETLVHVDFDADGDDVNIRVRRGL
jgi:hypothetical protein